MRQTGRVQSTFSSRAFPAWVAFCTAVAVAVASGIVVNDSVPARIVAGLVGLVVGVALAFATAAVLPKPRAPEQPQPQPRPEPEAAAPAEAPTVVYADDRRARLEAQLAADPNGDVEGWIAASRALVAETVPGASGYFAALGSRSFDDEQARLDAHRARLATIVRDFL